MKVITISGYAEAGKDTVARQIKWEMQNLQFNARVCIIHYADMLKFLCEKMYDWNGQKDEKGRELLQHIGTDVVRSKDSDFWVKLLSMIIEMFSSEFEYFIIPDCRFPNEVDAMKSQFDTVAVKVVRPNYQNHLTPEQRRHPSETSMDNYRFDYIITNPGTEVLEENVIHFIRRCL